MRRKNIWVTKLWSMKTETQLKWELFTPPQICETRYAILKYRSFCYYSESSAVYNTVGS
jgi:hypothetical protein